MARPSRATCPPCKIRQICRISLWLPDRHIRELGPLAKTHFHGDRLRARLKAGAINGKLCLTALSCTVEQVIDEASALIEAVALSEAAEKERAVTHVYVDEELVRDAARRMSEWAGTIEDGGPPPIKPECRAEYLAEVRALAKRLWDLGASHPVPAPDETPIAGRLN